MMVAAAGKGGGRAGRLHREGDHWFCSSVLQSDIMIEVEGIFFHLHKFPLISKCGKIARVVDGAQSPKEPLHHTLVGCPGGPDGFYIAATFCYGAQVEFSPKNAFMVYCISEFLEMTEEYGSDAEDHPVVHKCLNALSMMACTDPSLFGWPMMMYGSLQSPGGSILWNGINTGAKIRSAISDWWFEDVSCLGVPMFKKLIETMNKFGIRPENTTAAIIYYARKHLPGLARRLSGQGGKIRSIASLSMMPAVLDQKALVESIIELLPEKKDNLYDTDSVERMIRHFWSFREANIEFFSPMSSETAVLPLSGRFANVTKLVDTYLAEVAPDVNLKPQKMKSLMEALPESCRTLDDGMYRALDIYFKEHPWLPERERAALHHHKLVAALLRSVHPRVAERAPATEVHPPSPILRADAAACSPIKLPSRRAQRQHDLGCRGDDRRYSTR
ncbi:hypothetical protein HPP92_019698 [Vanilla planifolia]|uniref:NPH3 domain-containing protein n=1 Tax=Vanilla planifolia TaxID=51239 RepID=A0A835UJK0_VANPL|nr:hypothetical protein HPP92_019698 [Vanilla planifolia]